MNLEAVLMEHDDWVLSVGWGKSFHSFNRLEQHGDKEIDQDDLISINQSR